MMTVFSKPLAMAALIMGFIALTAFSGWRAVSAVSTIIDERVSAAEAARDAHWKAEIEQANVVAAKNVIEQMRVSHAADLATRAEIDRLKTEISELERKNADLPDVDGSGIDLERTRLLNYPSVFADRPH
ncbi:hypothetical protein [Brucella pseudogrignonensis]|uniref:hypothetical protein n=1 Tax=Brucella pseudogrignonensis TaxID=419475 RepID=UPI003ECE3F28